MNLDRRAIINKSNSFDFFR